eukprot:jgi/Phyca11/532615/estExt2_fgenesh1_pg.C_PHYCAscaffold_60161
MTGRIRFNWEDAVAQDRDLERINTFVKLTISKFPGQPAPHVDAGRGSRYEPAPPAPVVKSEPLQTSMVVANGSISGSSSGGTTPQFINLRDYTSESSSEIDNREVNPMDELSDFESDTSQIQEQQLEPVQPLDVVHEHQEEEEDVEQPMDVEMEEEEQTACEICKSSHRESEIVLCDDCNGEYHIFCLKPPLPNVPEGTWYCPNCKDKHPVSEVTVKAEQVVAAAANTTSGANSATPEATATPARNDRTMTAKTAPSGTAPTSGNGQDNGTDGNDPTAIPIVQALEADPEKCNALLIHACNCDNVKCTDLEFHAFCAHMKRFLRSVCWASHIDEDPLSSLIYISYDSITLCLARNVSNSRFSPEFWLLESGV